MAYAAGLEELNVRDVHEHHASDEGNQSREKQVLAKVSPVRLRQIGR